MNSIIPLHFQVVQICSPLSAKVGRRRHRMEAKTTMGAGFAMAFVLSGVAPDSVWRGRSEHQAF